MFEVVEKKDVTGVLRLTTVYILFILFVLNGFVAVMSLPALQGNTDYSEIVDTFGSESVEQSEVSYAEMLNKLVVLSAVLSFFALITHTIFLFFESRDKKIVLTEKRFVPERVRKSREKEC